MSARLNVILLEGVEGLGEAGEIVAVTEGYARNFLFPQGKAALADAATQTAAKQQADAERAATQEELAALRGQAERLEGTELTLPARVKEGDEIFGSITARQIAAALHQEAQLKISAKDIVLKEPLTRLGSTPVTIKLASDVEATIRVTIVPDEEA
jgi:large subunit ribosomal protein L9